MFVNHPRNSSDATTWRFVPARAAKTHFSYSKVDVRPQRFDVANNWDSSHLLNIAAPTIGMHVVNLISDFIFMALQY
jgi:hypothetical protein